MGMTKLVLTAAMMAAAAPAMADNFLVDSTADSGPGTLRDAVAGANAAGSGEIMFDLPAGSVITLTSGDLVFTGSDLGVYGPGRSLLAISGNGTSRIFDIQSGSFIITDITLRDGLALGDASNAFDEVGGAIHMRNESPARIPMQAVVAATTLTVLRSDFIDNRADAPDLALGGAIGVQGDVQALITDAAFSGNSTPFGGGAIALVGSSSLDNVALGSFAIDLCTFVGNHIDQNGAEAGQGAAILTYGPGGAISRSVIRGNVVNDAPADVDFSEGIGGGLAIVMSTLPVSIDQTEISDNTIALRADAYSEGAGLYCENEEGDATPLTITNSTISGNQSEYGAAIEAGCHLELRSSTIASNISPNTNGDGDAIEMIYAEGQFNADSTIVANPDAHVDLYLFEGATNLGTVEASLVFAPDPGAPPLPADTIIGVDPMLEGLRNNGGITRTQALLAGSPAIDVGDNAGDVGGDQRGPQFARVVGAAADIGAFEFDPDRILTNGFE